MVRPEAGCRRARQRRRDPQRPDGQGRYPDRLHAQDRDDVGKTRREAGRQAGTGTGKIAGHPGFGQDRPRRRAGLRIEDQPRRCPGPRRDQQRNRYGSRRFRRIQRRHRHRDINQQCRHRARQGRHQRATRRDGSQQQRQPHAARRRARHRAGPGPGLVHPRRSAPRLYRSSCRTGPCSGGEREEALGRNGMQPTTPRYSGPAWLAQEGSQDPPPGPRLIADNRGLVGYGLGKSFRRRPVLRDVSVSVQRGEVVGLLGPNGAGKTTCFYIITGLITADTGTVELDGQDITDLPMYRRARLGIGYLPQEASIFRGLTVEQNIRAILEVAEPEPETREAMLDALLAEFSISHLRRASAMALSGGERRRVEIARALATEPNFILLDEPLAGIDPIAVGDIRDLVAHLKDRGIGVLITDHNVRDTLKIVDRAYILHEGRVLMEGAPDEIVADAEVRRVYLGERFSL